MKPEYALPWFVFCLAVCTVCCLLATWTIRLLHAWGVRRLQARYETVLAALRANPCAECGHGLIQHCGGAEGDCVEVGCHCHGWLRPKENESCDAKRS